MDKDEQIEKLSAALRDAYTFISQPQSMHTPKDGPKTAVYRIEGYNVLTSRIRVALGMGS